ncbi:hypothetical protein GCM10017767_06510 [Halomonas urumqiensis]|nr:hypothetical protein GCM10017767_06510 [Halomonas urumqiensis]
MRNRGFSVYQDDLSRHPVPAWTVCLYIIFPKFYAYLLRIFLFVEVALSTFDLNVNDGSGSGGPVMPTTHYQYPVYAVIVSLIEFLPVTPPVSDYFLDYPNSFVFLIFCGNHLLTLFSFC